MAHSSRFFGKGDQMMILSRVEEICLFIFWDGSSGYVWKLAWLEGWQHHYDFLSCVATKISSISLISSKIQEMIVEHFLVDQTILNISTMGLCLDGTNLISKINYNAWNYPIFVIGSFQVSFYSTHTQYFIESYFQPKPCYLLFVIHTWVLVRSSRWIVSVFPHTHGRRTNKKKFHGMSRRWRWELGDKRKVVKC